MFAQIKKRRNALGLNQTEMADRAKIPMRTYQDYEAGKRPIPGDRLEDIAKALNCSVGDLYGSSKITAKDLASGNVEKLVALLEQRLPEKSQVDEINYLRAEVLRLREHPILKAYETAKPDNQFEVKVLLGLDDIDTDDVLDRAEKALRSSAKQHTKA